MNTPYGSDDPQTRKASMVVIIGLFADPPNPLREVPVSLACLLFGYSFLLSCSLHAVMRRIADPEIQRENAAVQATGLAMGSSVVIEG